MAFDPVFARDVALPLVEAAYDVMNGNAATLPPGFSQTALIRADRAVPAGTTAAHAEVAAMLRNTNVFGLMGRNPATRMAFVSFRGSADLADWLADFDVVPTAYRPIANFGEVATGFQRVYELVRASIAANLATATAGCDQILLTGDSLGAAVAVLAAPDIFKNMPPNTIEPRLITFAGPRVGLSAFAAAFNTLVESCFRLVNFLDIVPQVPPTPYVHVGVQVAVNSGGPIDVGWRHSLDAYRAGLTALMAAGLPPGDSVQ